MPPIISSAMAAINHTSNIGSWVDQYLAPISRESWAADFSEKEPRVWDGFLTVCEAPSEVRIFSTYPNHH